MVAVIFFDTLFLNHYSCYYIEKKKHIYSSDFVILKSLLQKTHTEWDVFARVSSSMAQVASQCEVSGFNIYFSSCCSCWIKM